MNGYSNQETFRLVELLHNDEDFIIRTVEHMRDSGTDFDSKWDIANELQHWIIGMYFEPTYWTRDLGLPHMPVTVIRQALSVGTMERIEWIEAVDTVQEFANHYLAEELAYIRD
jgi:hypothetical protein